MVATGLTFLFRYVGNIRVFASFGDWRYDEKRRKRRGSAAGSLASSIGNIRGFAFFSGEAEGERRERRWVRGGKEGKEEDLMRMNPKRSRI